MNVSQSDVRIQRDLLLSEDGDSGNDEGCSANKKMMILELIGRGAMKYG